MKKEVSLIEINSKEYYKKHPKECSYHNWTARMIAFLEFGKRVYPEPCSKEIKAFKDQRSKRR